MGHETMEAMRIKTILFLFATKGSGEMCSKFEICSVARGFLKAGRHHM